MANIDTKPIYKKLKRDIIEQIRKKRLHPGEKLPSLRKMAKQKGISMAPVLQAIAELDAEGYIVRYQGKGVFVTNPKKTPPQNGKQEIALVVPGIDTNEMFARMAKKMQECCGKNGYREVVLSTESYKNEADLIEKLPELGYAGAIIFPPADSETTAALQKNISQKFPFVLINPNQPSIIAPRITGNDFFVGYLTTQHLTKLGHRHIGIVSPFKDFQHQDQRYRGYLQGLTEADIEPKNSLVVVPKEIMHRPEKLISWGQNAGRQLLEDNPDITAVVAPPAIAAGIYRSMFAVGKLVPDDISLVCFGTSMNYLIPIKATAIDFYDEDIIAKAVEVLTSEIKEGPQGPIHINLPCKLVQGKTTAPPALVGNI